VNWTIFFNIALIFILLSIVYYLYFAVLSPNAGPVYKPTPIKRVREMLKFACLEKNDQVVDLGSGDGRFLIEAVKMGAEKAIGYEIDPLLIWESRQKVKKASFEKRITIYAQSFWKADFNQASIIVAYMFPKYLKKLYPLLNKKLKRKITLVSYDYQIPQIKPDQKKGNIYLYRLPRN